MIPNRIYLQDATMEVTGGTYGIVTGTPNTGSSTYLNFHYLEEYLQAKANEQAALMCNLPEGASRETVTASWSTYMQILKDIRNQIV